MQSLILRFDEDDAGVPARDAGAAAPDSRAVGFGDMTGEWMRDAPRARRVSRARVWHLPMRSEPGAFPRKRRNVVVAIILKWVIPRKFENSRLGVSPDFWFFALDFSRRDDEVQTNCPYNKCTCTPRALAQKLRLPIAINRRQVTSVDRRNDPRARDWSRYE